MSSDTVEGGAPEKFVLSASRGFEQLLASLDGCLAFTTYQAGKLFLLGVSAAGRLSVFERTFPRCMGLAVSDDGRRLLLATHYQIFRLDDVSAGSYGGGDHDALFAPRMSWITGDLDAHDIGFDTTGRAVFVNTLFSCLAQTSDGYSFRPLWRPPFISKLTPEDRCHLNGMAMENGAPRFVTAVSTSDVTDSWRDRRVDGGVVIDVATSQIVARGLSMPHSPRLRNGELWLLNSGRGELGRVDLDSGAFTPVAFCPGYARGLAFKGNLAFVGLSRPRSETRTFTGLPLDDALAARDAEARCGLLVINVESGDTVGWVRIEGVVRELYDVVHIPHARRPALIGLRNDEILRIISVDDRA